MGTKRYVAEDMRQALKQIRDELGPDAVILSNRRVSEGVEIVASVDLPEADTAVTFGDQLADDHVELSSVYNARGGVEAELMRAADERAALKQQAAAGQQQTTSQQQAAQQQTAAQAAAQQPSTHAQQPEQQPARRAFGQRRVFERQAGTAGNVAADGQAQIDDTFAHMMAQAQQAPRQSNVEKDLLNAMRSEIDNLRLLLKDQMEHNSDERWAMKNPLEAAAVQRLVGQGISRPLARKLALQQHQAETIEETWQGCLQDLATDIPVLDKSPVGRRGVIALLGATGAGKTTTIAKLAVRYALKFGPDQLALVTTDSYRLAAYEELRTLGRIIDVPVRQVDEYNSLDDVLASLKHKSMVLIDTAGFHAEDKERIQQLEMLEHAKVAIKKLLVLPSTSQSKVLKSMYELMATVKLDGCVITKVDETGSLGEVLSLVVENTLPVAYITNGQKIPDDIGKARPDKLVQSLAGQSSEAGDVPFNTITTPSPVAARQHA